MGVANKPMSWQVQFASSDEFTGVTRKILGDVQSVSVTTGRPWATDQYTPGTCVIQSRNVSAWTTTPQLGDMIAVVYGDIDDWYSVPFFGWIKDVQINYGIVANLDTATITCEGTLAKWGRTQINARAIAQAITTTQASNVATAENLINYYASGGTGLSTASAQTFTGNGLDYLNTLALTEVGHLRESYSTFPLATPYRSRVVFYQRNSDRTVGYTYSDNPTASQIKYDEILFTSAAQDYYTTATINPTGLASQTSGSGNFALVQDSFDVSTAQALSHAQYLVSQYNSKTSTPYQISATFANNQDTQTRRDLFVKSLDLNNNGAGSYDQIIHRGVTYPVIVEGVEVVSDPSETRVTVSFSSYDNNNYLVLNNATFGTLGTSSTYPGNKLGF